MTGHKPVAQPIAEVHPLPFSSCSDLIRPIALTCAVPAFVRLLQQKAQASAASAGAAAGSNPTGHFGREETVESQILRLAGSLGVKSVPVLPFRSSRSPSGHPADQPCLTLSLLQAPPADRGHRPAPDALARRRLCRHRHRHRLDPDRGGGGRRPGCPHRRGGARKAPRRRHWRRRWCRWRCWKPHRRACRLKRRAEKGLQSMRRGSGGDERRREGKEHARRDHTVSYAPHPAGCRPDRARENGEP